MQFVEIELDLGESAVAEAGSIKSMVFGGEGVIDPVPCTAPAQVGAFSS